MWVLLHKGAPKCTINRLPNDDTRRHKYRLIGAKEILIIRSLVICVIGYASGICQCDKRTSSRWILEAVTRKPSATTESPRPAAYVQNADGGFAHSFLEVPDPNTFRSRQSYFTSKLCRSFFLQGIATSLDNSSPQLLYEQN